MRIIYLILLMSSTIFAYQPYNSNILIERGISPEVINSTISMTRQNAAYKMAMKSITTSQSQTNDLEYFVIVDPYNSYGVDVQIEAPVKQLALLNQSHIEDRLEELMGIQLYVQEVDIYDSKSLKILSENESETIITFDFNKKALPNELKHIRPMKGYIYIVNGILEKIVIKNSTRFSLRGVEVDSYEKVSYFTKVPQNGGYLLTADNLEVAGSYKELPYHETLSGQVVKYWDVIKKPIAFNSEIKNPITKVENEEYKTISINLDRIFPLLGKEARKAGFELPKAFGVSLINMFQDTTMHMNSFKIDGVDLNFNKVLDGDSVYRNITYSPLVRADMWLFPFLSIGLIVGGTDTTTNVTLESDSGLIIERPIQDDIVLIKPGAKLNLDPFTTNAFLYGVGATIAGGVGDFFTTIDFQYILAYTSAADVSIEMLIVTPLIGYHLSDYDTRFFIGAQYQDLANTLTFSVTSESGENLSGEVGLHSESWAGVVGGNYDFTRNWSSNLLYSHGVDRKNVVLGVTYRF